MIAPSAFRVLSRVTAPVTWQSALMNLFRVCREIADGLRADMRAGRFSDGICAHCSGFRHTELGDLREQIKSLCNDYPLSLESPFEDVETISGGIWRASEVLKDDDKDALLRLHFQANTLDLPLHSHDFSDRVIFVADGCGVFEHVVDSYRMERNSVEVRAGDALIFSRGTVHSFRTTECDLQLLSYHSPFIDLGDERQFSVLQ